MRATTRTFISIGLSASGALAVAMMSGCRTPPPPRVQIPVDSRGNEYTRYDHDPVKPLPESASRSVQESPQSGQVLSAPAPVQPPAVSQAYLESYDRVGRPRLMVVVDRAGAAGGTGAAGGAKSIVPGDYDTLERVVRDALAADGQVLVAPAGATRQLNEKQLEAIAAGDAKAIADAGAALNADVLVQVRVAPTAAEREETQITATARNTRDAAQIATAAASIPPPPQRRQIDFAGRLLAERLVDELAGAWENLSRIPPAGATTTQPAAASAPAPAPPPAPAPAATQPDRPGLSG